MDPNGIGLGIAAAVDFWTGLATGIGIGAVIGVAGLFICAFSPPPGAPRRGR